MLIKQADFLDPIVATFEKVYVKAKATHVAFRIDEVDEVIDQILEALGLVDDYEDGEIDQWNVWCDAVRRVLTDPDTSTSV